MEEDSRKRHHGDSNDGYGGKRHGTGGGKPSLKILVPNFVAGKLIGKGGANINELQSTFSATIQLSANKDFYPGTEDRIVIISADTEQIIQFTNYVIEDVLVEQDSAKNTNPRQEVKMVVTNVAAGLVIGKGGAVIKEIQEKSGARINISKRTEGCEERIIIINGDIQQRVLACRLIIEKMAEEPGKISISTIRYSSLNNSIPIPANAPLPNNFLGNTQNMLLNSFPNALTRTVNGMGNNYNILDYTPKSKAKAKFMVEMEIADTMVGSVLGKNGQTINELSRSSGAKLQFSAKNEFVPGTTDRILTITGGMNQVQSAYKLVDQLLAQVELEFGRNVRLS